MLCRREGADRLRRDDRLNRGGTGTELPLPTALWQERRPGMPVAADDACVAGPFAV
jgi:hypothetical protein